VAVVIAAVLATSCLIGLHVYEARSSPEFEALKTITLVLNSHGQVVSQGQAAPAQSSAGGTSEQTIHLDLDGHGNVLNQPGAVDDGSEQDDGQTMSIALDNNGQMVSRRAEQMTAPETPQQLAQEQAAQEQAAQEGPPTYNSYPKLTWPEPPEGFGLNQQQQLAQGGPQEASQGGKPITILLDTGKQGNARPVVANHAAASEPQSLSQSDMKEVIRRDTRRMFHRLEARDQRREQKLALDLKKETGAAVMQMKQALASGLSPLSKLLAPKTTQLGVFSAHRKKPTMPAFGARSFGNPPGLRRFAKSATMTMHAKHPLEQLAAVPKPAKKTDIADALTSSVKKSDDPELMEYLHQTLDPIKAKLQKLKQRMNPPQIS